MKKNEPKDKIDINKLEAITPSIRSLSAIILINYIIMKKRMGFLKSDLILVEKQKKHIWMKIKANLDNNGDSYFYETFNSDDKKIKNITITDIEFIHGEELNRSKSISTLDENKLNFFIENVDIKFYSFHVGQGMCSLLTNGDKGILFDMGAGKPILRKDYTTLITNELANELLNKLNAVYIFLSHLDSDHSRLMEWEISLGNNINFQEKIINIFIPHMQKSLSFKNEKIIEKIIEIDKDIFIKNNLIECTYIEAIQIKLKKIMIALLLKLTSIIIRF